MKTLEEKAKAYDNTVNKLRRFMEHGIDPLITRADVQDFFPELTESDDERIRKEIISHLQHEYVVKRYVSDVEYDRWIAWLEKQGKPKWTDEDEERLQSCIIALGGVDTMDSKWLKSLKQRMEEQQWQRK